MVELMPAIARDLKVYARRRWPLDTDERRQDRLLRMLPGFTHRRIKSFYEGERTAVPRHDETEAVERLIGKKIGAPQSEADHVEQRLQAQIAASRAEYRDLEARIARLETLFAPGNAEHVGPHVDALRAFASGQGQGPARGGPQDGPRGLAVAPAE